MAFDKHFTQAIQNCLDQPNDPTAREVAGQALLDLCGRIASKMKLPKYQRADIEAEAVARAWKKLDKADPKKGKGKYFGFFWGMLQNDILKGIYKDKKFYANHIVNYTPRNKQGDYIKGGLENMPEARTLEVDLDAYKSKGQEAEAPEAVKGDRKKYKTKTCQRQSNGIAISSWLWEAYTTLKEKKEMSEEDLVAIGTKGGMKSAEKNMVRYVRIIAKDKGEQTSIVKRGDKKFVVLGETPKV